MFQPFKQVYSALRRTTGGARLRPLPASLAVLVLAGAVTSGVLFNSSSTPAGYTGCGYGFTGYGYANGYGNCPAPAPAPAPAPTPIGSSYKAITPTRICDTRPSNPSNLSGPAAQCNGTSNAGTTLSAGGTLAIDTETSSSWAPSNAVAVVANVTVTGTTSAGYLEVVPQSASFTPGTVSNLNWTTGQTVANLVTVPVNQSNGQIEIYNYAGSANVIVDLEGYYVPSSSAGTGLYNALSAPERICDTRPANPSNLSGAPLTQCENNAPAPGTSLTIQVTGLGAIPASNVAAVVLNVTAIDPSAAGYLTVYPAGITAPTASNVNYVTGQIVPNSVIVPVSSTGQISIYSSDGSPNIAVDVSGYYTGSASSTATGGLYVPITTPTRVCDTRAGNPSNLSGPILTQCQGKTLGTAGTLDLSVEGSGYPIAASAATAVIANLTATNTTAASFMTAIAAGATRLLVSNLNWTPGEVVANMAIVTVGSNGQIELYNNTGNVDAVVDLFGYFVAG